MFVRDFLLFRKSLSEAAWRIKTYSAGYVGKYLLKIGCKIKPGGKKLMYLCKSFLR
jgi:hypothetical protein